MLICKDLKINKSPTCLTIGTKLVLHVLPLEPNWSYHQIHQKQIIGTPTSKSYEPLIAEDDYELSKLPYMSHNWYQPIFGFSVYLTTEVVNFKLSKWYISWRNFSTKKSIIYTLISSSRAIDCLQKNNLSILVQKLTFLP